MELHTCTNCQMINKLIGKQFHKFNILNEENVVLHNLLIQARQSLQKVSDKLLRSHEALAAEREQNLLLHLKGVQKNKSNFINNTANLPNTHTDTSNGSNKDVLQSKEYKQLMNVVETLKETHQMSLAMLHNDHERHNTLLKHQIEQSEEQVSVILELNKSLRMDLFLQKKQNIKDHEEFLQTVDILTLGNQKYIQDIKHNIIMATISTADTLTKQKLNSMHIQILERDQLVTKLCKQYSILQEQVLDMEQRENRLKNDYKIVIDTLKAQLKYERKKLNNFEQRRKFDVEGFHNDIKTIRKEINILKKKNQKPQDVESKEHFIQVSQNVDKISNRLNAFYLS